MSDVADIAGVAVGAAVTASAVVVVVVIVFEPASPLPMICDALEPVAGAASDNGGTTPSLLSIVVGTCTCSGINGDGVGIDDSASDSGDGGDGGLIATAALGLSGDDKGENDRKFILLSCTMCVCAQISIPLLTHSSSSKKKKKRRIMSEQQMGLLKSVGFDIHREAITAPSRPDVSAPYNTPLDQLSSSPTFTRDERPRPTQKCVLLRLLPNELLSLILEFVLPRPITTNGVFVGRQRLHTRPHSSAIINRLVREPPTTMHAISKAWREYIDIAGVCVRFGLCTTCIGARFIQNTRVGAVMIMCVGLSADVRQLCRQYGTLNSCARFYTLHSALSPLHRAAHNAAIARDEKQACVMMSRALAAFDMMQIVLFRWWYIIRAVSSDDIEETRLASRVTGHQDVGCDHIEYHMVAFELNDLLVGIGRVFDLDQHATTLIGRMMMLVNSAVDGSDMSDNVRMKTHRLANNTVYRNQQDEVVADRLINALLCFTTPQRAHDAAIVFVGKHIISPQRRLRVFKRAVRTKLMNTIEGPTRHHGSGNRYHYHAIIAAYVNIMLHHGNLQVSNTTSCCISERARHFMCVFHTYLYGSAARNVANDIATVAPVVDNASRQFINVALVNGCVQAAIGKHEASICSLSEDPSDGRLTQRVRAYVDQLRGIQRVMSDVNSAARYGWFNAPQQHDKRSTWADHLRQAIHNRQFDQVVAIIQSLE